MKKSLLMIAVITATLVLPSCYSTRTAVGNYQTLVTTDEQAYTFSKGKQLYLIGGLIPLDRKQVAVPDHGDCQIRTRLSFVDLLVSAVTLGIFNMQTIEVKVPLSKTTNAAVPAQYQNAAPAQYQNAAPAQYQNPAPVQYQNAAPAQYQNPAPAQYQNAAPAQYQNAAPAQYQNPAPVQYQNPAPVQ